jgi:hypothetical protein
MMMVDDDSLSPPLTLLVGWGDNYAADAIGDAGKAIIKAKAKTGPITVHDVYTPVNIGPLIRLAAQHAANAVERTGATAIAVVANHSTRKREHTGNYKTSHVAWSVAIPSTSYLQPSDDEYDSDDDGAESGMDVDGGPRR